jgi:hypothetical protein
VLNQVGLDGADLKEGVCLCGQRRPSALLLRKVRRGMW